MEYGIVTRGCNMRPRIEGKEECKVLHLINTVDSNLTPTQLIYKIINKYYESIYPRGEDLRNGNIKETQTSCNK